jgi:hypothetical protein
MRIRVALRDEQFAIPEDQGSGDSDDGHGSWRLVIANRLLAAEGLPL